jgi:hypothetical protein
MWILPLDEGIGRNQTRMVGRFKYEVVDRISLVTWRKIPPPLITVSVFTDAFI